MRITKTLAKKIRNKRKSLNLSQRALSKRSGLSQGFISRIEQSTGQITASEETLYWLAKGLGADIDWYGYPSLKVPRKLLPIDNPSDVYLEAFQSFLAHRQEVDTRVDPELWMMRVPHELRAKLEELGLL